MPPAARIAWLGALGVALALLPANRLLFRLGLRHWRLAALFLPSIGPAVFMWLVAFSGAPEQGGHGAAREGATLSRPPISRVKTARKKNESMRWLDHEGHARLPPCHEQSLRLDSPFLAVQATLVAVPNPGIRLISSSEVK